MLSSTDAAQLLNSARRHPTQRRGQCDRHLRLLRPTCALGSRVILALTSGCTCVPAPRPTITAPPRSRPATFYRRQQVHRERVALYFCEPAGLLRPALRIGTPRDRQATAPQYPGAAGAARPRGDDVIDLMGAPEGGAHLSSIGDAADRFVAAPSGSVRYTAITSFWHPGYLGASWLRSLQRRSSATVAGARTGTSREAPGSREPRRRLRGLRPSVGLPNAHGAWSPGRCHSV